MRSALIAATVLLSLLLPPAAGLAADDWVIWRNAEGVTVRHPPGWAVQPTETGLVLVQPQTGEALVIGIDARPPSGGGGAVARSLLERASQGGTLQLSGAWQEEPAFHFQEAWITGNDGQTHAAQVMVVVVRDQAAYGLYVGPRAGYARDRVRGLIHGVVLSMDGGGQAAPANAPPPRTVAPTPQTPPPRAAAPTGPASEPLHQAVARGEAFRAPERGFSFHAPRGFQAEDFFTRVELSPPGDDESTIIVRWLPGVSASELVSHLSRPTPFESNASERTACQFVPLAHHRQTLPTGEVVVSDAVHPHHGVEHRIRRVVIAAGPQVMLVEGRSQGEQGNARMREQLDSVVRSLRLSEHQEPSEAAARAIAGRFEASSGMHAVVSQGHGYTLELCADGTGRYRRESVFSSPAYNYSRRRVEEHRGRWLVFGTARRGTVWIIDEKGDGRRFDYEVQQGARRFNDQVYAADGDC